MNLTDNFEKSIKGKLENYQDQPSPQLWKSIENTLNKNARAKKLFFLKYAAAIALMTTTVWGSYHFLYNSSEQAGNIVVNKDNLLSEKHFPEILKPITSFDSDNLKPDTNKESTAHVQEPITDAINDSIDTEAKAKEKYIAGKEEKIEEVDLLVKSTIKPESQHTPTQKGGIDPSEINTTNKNTLMVDMPEIDFSSVAFTGTDETLSDKITWSVGFHTAPQYSFRFNSSDPDDLDGGKTIFERNESHLLSYNVGFEVTYHFNDKLEINSGFNFVSMGQSIRNIDIKNHPNNLPVFKSTAGRKNPQSLLTSMGEISFNDPTLYFEDISNTLDEKSNRVKSINEINIIDDFNLQDKGNRLNQYLGFIEMPLILKYNLYNRLMKIQLKSGISVNYLINNNVVLYKDDVKNTIGKTSLIRNWNTSLIGGTAFVFSLSENINLHLEPTLNIFVSSMTHGKEYNVYPYSFSLYTGLSIPIH